MSKPLGGNAASLGSADWHYRSSNYNPTAQNQALGGALSQDPAADSLQSVLKSSVPGSVPAVRASGSVPLVPGSAHAGSSTDPSRASMLEPDAQTGAPDGQQPNAHASPQPAFQLDKDHAHVLTVVFEFLDDSERGCPILQRICIGHAIAVQMLGIPSK